MRGCGLAVAVTLVLLVGCLHTPQYGKEFSPDWVYHTEHGKEFEARKDRVRNTTLFGREGKARGKLETDSSGDTKLNLGKDTGISADVNLHGGDPDVRVKYRIKW